MVKTFKSFIQESEDYRGEHQAPDRHGGSPLHDVTKNGTYPDDFYSHNGFRYYSDHGSEHDHDSHYKVHRYRDQPDKKVWIHRAVPKDVYHHAIKHMPTPINHLIKPGDWVSISKGYAHDHGEANLDGHKVVSKRVPAKHIFTDGNSVHEWGYDPR